MFFYIAKLATAAAHKTRQKISGINTNPIHKAIFYSVSLWLFSAFAGEMHNKNYHYAKAAPHHYKSSFISLPFQSFKFSGSRYFSHRIQ
jgi:hypothetical protein